MAPKPVRVRIAPSPTGPLHVGTARAALFNELYARQRGGQFILRIEDTDQARSKPEFEKDILESLKWLGLTWDEGPDIDGAHGPYRQSERGEVYCAAIHQLLEAGKAYHVAGGEAIKLNVGSEEVVFEDLIRGRVSARPESWGGDFVIARSQDNPVFHLAVVVDDAAQGITHVIRGEDHLSNTARHILLQRALGVPTPQYAHLPLLLDEQRRKLSKRAGEVSLLKYRELGYLPQAMLNYLALLGWNPGDEREFFTHDELVQAFSLERVHKGGAIFSRLKLNAMNKYYLKQLPDNQLVEQLKPFLNMILLGERDDAFLAQAVATEQERAATLAELAAALTFFAPNDPGDYAAELLIWRNSNREETTLVLEKLIEKLAAWPAADFSEAALSAGLLEWTKQEQLDRGTTLWPMRVALTGREHSPGPFAVAAVLGKTETTERLHAALGKLKAL